MENPIHRRMPKRAHLLAGHTQAYCSGIASMAFSDKARKVDGGAPCVTFDLKTFSLQKTAENLACLCVNVGEDEN